MQLTVKIRIIIQCTLRVKLSKVVPHDYACQIGRVPRTVSSSSNEMDMVLESSLVSLGDERRELRSGPNTSKSSSISFDKGPPCAAAVCSQFTNCGHKMHEGQDGVSATGEARPIRGDRRSGNKRHWVIGKVASQGTHLCEQVGNGDGLSGIVHVLIGEQHAAQNGIPRLLRHVDLGRRAAAEVLLKDLCVNNRFTG